MRFIGKANYWSGFSGLWMKECGSANFFIPGVLGALVSPFAFMIADQHLQSFALVFSLSALWMAFCWQVVKLQAQEGAMLFPALKHHVYKQGGLILLLGYAFNALAMINQPVLEVICSMLFASAYCGYFFLLTQRSSRHFKHNSYFFMLLLMAAMFFGHQPTTLAALAIPPSLIALYFIFTRQKNCHWHPEAYQTYLNNIQTGLLPVHTFTPAWLTQKFRHFLMPMSYFSGNLLLQTCQLFVLAGLLAIIAAVFFDANSQFLMMFMDVLTIMVAIFVCWSKLQTRMSWDQLYLLPIYSSLTSIKRAYHIVACKLALCLALYQLIIIVVCDSLSAPQPYSVYILIFAGSVSSFMLCIALGSIVNNTISLSLSCMFALVLDSALKAYLLEHHQDISSVLVMFGYCIAISLLLLYASKKVE